MKNPKKSLILSVLLIGVVLALLCTACADKDKEHTVKYEITGPAAVATYVQYINDTGGRDQINGVTIPWSKTITVKGNCTVHCAVSIDYSNENIYTTTIYVDGKLVKSSSGTTIVMATSHTE